MSADDAARDDAREVASDDARDRAASIIERLRRLPDAQRRRLLARYRRGHAARLGQAWQATARPEQLPPPGDWRVWLILAGRGFGKTRAGAEWVDAYARANGGTRIALVGANLDDVRHVMIEGESGILACARGRPVPLWSPSLKRLLWPNGAMARCYSAAEPETLRGPAHHIGWADEVARWDAGGGSEAGGQLRSRAMAAWDNLLMGLRLGDRPRLLATTTPRAVPLVRAILAMEGLVRSGGATDANRANLSGAFLAAMQDLYGDGTIGRQEIGGEMIEDVDGALWTRALIEARRMPGDVPATARVVIGVDPPASSGGDACGIVVAAALAEPAGDGTEMVVLADASVERASPERWARAVAEAAVRWGADRIVAEANNGGEMVRSVLEAEDRNLPVRLVHATRGKAQRAEPVAHAYARGRVRHVGAFAALEDQLCGLTAGGGYAGPGRSPDRADACVWALAELMRGAGQGWPRVRMI